jgi:hypothetical protein
MPHSSLLLSVLFSLLTFHEIKHATRKIRMYKNHLTIADKLQISASNRVGGSCIIEKFKKTLIDNHFHSYENITQKWEWADFGCHF